MISAHLPILQIVVPLLAAPISVFFRRAAIVWYLTLIVSIITLAISITLLAQTLDQGVISYALGNWAAPFGIEYRIDAVNAFVLVIISAIGTIVLPYARVSVANEI